MDFILEKDHILSMIMMILHLLGAYVEDNIEGKNI